MPSNVQTLEVETGAFRVADEGPREAPVLVLSNSLGTTLEMWDAQAEVLSQRLRVIRYDTRGHGGSVVSSGPYSVSELARDVLQILDALGVERAAFCGISMGGITGLALALAAPERLTHVVVANSAAKIGDAAMWRERADLVRREGAKAMSQLAETAPGRWFTPAFTAAHPEVVQRTQAWIANTAPEGYAACCDALGEADLREPIAAIRTPTLLIAGEVDPTTTVADAQFMQAAIDGAQLRVLPTAHLSNVEAAEAFTQALADFVQPGAAG
ncbi:3-oxoadipate enol-lactonase [Comamonas serinivorans]|uniref:3-oxoadipate enol-lactonase n=1 Tax=Comamonas serinivorans TaxID=1082851 RepID=A0A1Y0ELG0_9BURK|nr:3-oxoadipate enol-lactonase [Comamonas serinivorans]ARU04238.1 3-oxoadipate enol-lactonase [Comamonas serinivorans]